MNQFVGGVKQYKGKHYMATKMFRRPWLKKKNTDKENIQGCD